MNQKLPRPLQNALARQAGGEVHPSPDVLTSFMERTLPLDERDLVTHHLALCADCREVVFLAGSAAEDVIADEKELVAAAAHQLVPSPVYANVHLQPAAQAETPRRRWALGLSWASAALAVLLVAGVLVWQRFGSQNPARQPVSTVASNGQTPGVAQPLAPAMPSATDSLGKNTSATTTPLKTASPKASASVTAGALAQKGGEAYPSGPKVALAPPVENAQTPPGIEGGLSAAAPAPATHNSFAENQA